MTDWMRQLELAVDVVPPEDALRVADAMWAGDLDTLQEMLPCGCCCNEHTFPHCEARLWGGCRGGMPYGWGPEEEFGYLQSWQRHYARFHGMAEADFYGHEEDV